MQTGKRFIKGISQLTQGTHYNYTAGGHRLIKCRLRPPAAEVTALHLGEVTFGLYVENVVLFFLCRIGSGPWTASHYNWWLNPPPMRPDPLAELGAGDRCMLLFFELVDAADGCVAAEKLFAISPEPAAMLRRCVAEQIEAILDPFHHLDIAGRVLGRHPDLSWMAAEARWLECPHYAEKDRIPAEDGRHR